MSFSDPPTSVQLNSADLASPVKVGESVRVRCTCDSGNPLPELKLYQNGIELSGYKSVTSQQVSHCNSLMGLSSKFLTDQTKISGQSENEHYEAKLSVL